MAQSDWVFSIEPKIYTIIKTRLTNALLSTYPKLYITQQEKLNDDTSLPAIYIKMLDSPEMGADLDNTTVNALMATFEVHITIAKSGTDNGLAGMRKIASEVLNNFKKIRFNVIFRGEINRETSDTYSFISRYRRVIGADEEINL